MRLVACAAFVLSILVLAGCDGNDDSGNGDRAAWTADNLAGLDDSALVTEFNAYAESVNEQWERNPVTVVSEMLRLDGSDNPNVSIVSEAPPEAAEEATVTVTSSQLLDDSVEATRNIVQVELAGDVWRVAEVASSTSCKPGRGHQDFSTQPCV